MSMIFNKLIDPSKKTYITIFVLLSLSYLLNLKNVQFTGEEGVYTIMSYEMWYHQNWLTATHYGEPYWRPPLFNWLIIGLSHIFGWENSLACARFISGMSSVISGIALYAFVKKVYQDTDRAWITAIVYLASWQVLANYGWLAYSDAVFGLFCLLAMLSGYLAIFEGRMKWFLFACMAAYAAMLVKAITGFVFYGVVVLVSMAIYKKWRFAFSIKNIFLHCLVLVAISAWHLLIPGGESTGSGMFNDVLQKFSGPSLIDYAIHLLSFPLITWLNLLPISIFVVYIFFKNRKFNSEPIEKRLKIMILASLINFLPYWFSPQGHNRYVLPLYGFFALILVGLMYQFTNKKSTLDGDSMTWRRHFLRIIWVLLIIKILAAVWLFPLYTKKARPDIEFIAQDVMQIVKSSGQNLYASDGAWLGIAVAFTIDVASYPKPPLLMPPADLSDGFILHHANDLQVGNLFKSYKNKTFLLCRGRACQ